MSSRPTRRFIVHTTAVLALALAPPSPASPLGDSAQALGPDDAVRLALADQPLLAAQEASVTALREEAVAARQLPDPRLTVGIEGLPVDSFSLTEAEMTQGVLGISQMVPGGDKREIAGRRVMHQAARAEIQVEAERRRIARDVRLAWLDVYRPAAALDLVARIETETRRQDDWNRAAYTAGQVGQDETYALRAMLEAARNRTSELEGGRERARAALARWIGAGAARPLAKDATALTPFKAPADSRALAQGLDAHPEIRLLLTGLDVGRAEAEMARQERRPDWGVDFSYGIRGAGRPDVLKLMVGVDLPLFPKQRQDRRLAARIAELAAMQSMVDDRRRMLNAELEAAWAEWRSADVRLARLEKDILPLAALRVESALSAYKTGSAGYDRVLEARRAELEMRLEQLDLRVERAKAAVMLQYFE